MNNDYSNFIRTADEIIFQKKIIKYHVDYDVYLFEKKPIFEMGVKKFYTYINQYRFRINNNEFESMNFSSFKKYLDNAIQRFTPLFEMVQTIHDSEKKHYKEYVKQLKKLDVVFCY